LSYEIYRCLTKFRNTIQRWHPISQHSWRQNSVGKTIANTPLTTVFTYPDRVMWIFSSKQSRRIYLKKAKRRCTLSIYLAYLSGGQHNSSSAKKAQLPANDAKYILFSAISKPYKHRKPSLPGGYIYIIFYFYSVNV